MKPSAARKDNQEWHFLRASRNIIPLPHAKAIEIVVIGNADKR